MHMVKKVLSKEFVIEKLREMIQKLSEGGSTETVSIHYTELAAYLDVSTTYAQQLLKAYCHALNGVYVSGRCVVKILSDQRVESAVYGAQELQ